jgi:hypothetical protein
MAGADAEKYPAATTIRFPLALFEPNVAAREVMLLPLLLRADIVCTNPN